MVVVHNLYAMNAQRQYSITESSKKKSTEKLSSGFKINRAADDAAGLAISEKMRKQIRSLDRGADNIQEGISFVQTADGALNEVIECLQRIRVLSIQSYNETNSKSDIAAMQAEVDEILCEMDRISDTTTFNERKILKYDTTTNIVQLPDREEKYTARMTLSKVLPEWLTSKSDQTVESTNPNTGTQDTTGVMFQTITHADGTKEDIYYGPRQTANPEEKWHGATWYGDTPEGLAEIPPYSGWTPTITDNPSAKLDFSGLLDAADAGDLYQRIFDLMGTQIMYPCGTCYNHMAALRFMGEDSGFRSVSFIQNDLDYMTHYSEIDLNNDFPDIPYDGKTYNGLFEPVKKMAEAHNDPNSTLTPAEKSQQVRNMANEIATRLRDAALSGLMSAGTGHFDRFMVGPDAYSLTVYDFRDVDRLTNVLAANAPVIQLAGDVEFDIEQTRVIPGERYITHSLDKGLSIFAAGSTSDFIGLSLADVSVERLGLTGYKLGTQYDTLIEYTDEYKKKLADWREHGFTDKEVTTTENYVTYKILGFDKEYVNGEPRLRAIIDDNPTIKTQTLTKVIRTYSPPPAHSAADFIYTKVLREDVLDPVDKAITDVCAMRSRLGAQQNRLEHAYMINELTVENTTASESRIRDTDIAEEMVKYAKSNILEQAGQAMIAQANQTNQGVLTLLQ